MLDLLIIISCSDKYYLRGRRFTTSIFVIFYCNQWEMFVFNIKCQFNGITKEYTNGQVSNDVWGNNVDVCTVFIPSTLTQLFKFTGILLL